MSSAEDEIRALFAEFRATLPESVERLRTLVTEARANRPEALTDLVCAAHKLRGACGSFGMGELAEPARLIEMECKRGPDWSLVNTALDTLTKLLAS